MSTSVASTHTFTGGTGLFGEIAEAAADPIALTNGRLYVWASYFGNNGMPVTEVLTLDLNAVLSAIKSQD